MQSPEEFKKEKTERVEEVYRRFSMETLRIHSALYKLNRKMPRICIRGRCNIINAKRVIARKKILLLVQQILITHAARIQHGIILSQPTPKFQNGGIINNQQTIAGEYGEEKIEIISPNSTPGKQEQES